MRIKRLRRCLNAECAMTLRITWVREYSRLICPQCGAISVFNPIGQVQADQHKHTYVAKERGRAVEHILPKSRVLLPMGISN